MADAVEDALQLGQQTFADAAKSLHLEQLIPAPYSWILRLAAMAAPVLLIVGVAFWIWHGGAQHQAAKDKPVIAAATDRADVSDLNAKGAQDNAARVDAYQHLDIQVRNAVERANAQAGAAPDAHDTMPADRAARLHAADAELCRLQPALCDDAAVQANAGGGS